MGLAGVGAGDSVMFVGHSQGGLVAANLASAAGAQTNGAGARRGLASNPAYRVAGLVTVGAPIAHLAGKLEVPTMAIEHTNDVVPKLSLKANPLTENWVTVSRETPTDPANNRSDLVEAHDLEAYRDTAKQADESAEIGITEFRKKLSGYAAETGGGSGQNMAGVARWFEISRG
jgi:pimeloyl-ACP methyl ester carboxylesterase